MFFYVSFPVFVFMRIIHACLNSASNHLLFSLIADYFPPNKRSIPNSIILAGNYFGSGVSSISIFLLYYFGWEDQYFYMGLFGGFFAVLTILCVNEPSRRRYLDLATIN